MDLSQICENKKLVRYSKEYYEWILSVLEKRGLNEIWVAFSKTKFGLFDKASIIREINGR